MRIIQPLAILIFVCITILPIELLGQKIPTDFIRIRNRSKPDSYIHIERSPRIKASTTSKENRSAMWALRPVGDGIHFRIQNRKEPDVFIQLERNRLEASPNQMDERSAVWVLQRVGDGVHFRLENGGKPNQYVYIESGYLQAGPIDEGSESAMWTFQPLNAWPDNPPIVDTPDAPLTPEPEGPMHVGGDVKKPEKISTPQPQYTESARKARIQGVVIVQTIINKIGNVENVKVLKGLPMGLSEEAVKAVKTWTFKPATLNGKPVDVYYNLTVNFRLQ